VRSVRQHLLDGREDRVVRGVLSEKIQHQRAGPDRRDGVGDVLAIDVGAEP
jgi:hypothetical protein